MANSVLTLTIDPTLTDVTERYEHFFGTVAVAAGDYATGGFTLALNGTTELKTSRIPSASTVRVWSNTSGYVYTFTPGTTLANGKLQVFRQDGSTGPLAELSAGATPAGIVADTIRIAIAVKKGS